LRHAIISNNFTSETRCNIVHADISAPTAFCLFAWWVGGHQAYEHYDLVIWSATSWRWLEIKLSELGMVNNPRYSICFVLDKTSMFRIISETAEDGGTAQGAAASDKGAKPTMKEVKHSVKPLQMIWNKFPGEWSAK